MTATTNASARNCRQLPPRVQGQVVGVGCLLIAGVCHLQQSKRRAVSLAVLRGGRPGCSPSHLVSDEQLLRGRAGQRPVGLGARDPPVRAVDRDTALHRREDRAQEALEVRRAHRRVEHGADPTRRPQRRDESGLRQSRGARDAGGDTVIGARAEREAHRTGNREYRGDGGCRSSPSQSSPRVWRKRA